MKYNRCRRYIGLLILILLLFTNDISAQSKNQYLKMNRFNLLDTSFVFPQQNIHIFGFGAYHGSRDTEKAELILLKTLIRTQGISYYMPETDFSIAHYFNEYLKYGDTLLLKDLVNNYGVRIPQEKSIEIYQKWKAIKEVYDSQSAGNKLQVVGIDLIVNYKYTSWHILELLKLKPGISPAYDQLSEMVKIDTTDYSSNYNSYSKGVLSRLITAYTENKRSFHSGITDRQAFDHIMDNLNTDINSSGPVNRDKVMYGNYMALSDRYDFKNKPQFVRMGFFHLEKAPEGKSVSFFTALLKNGIYTKKEIISVIGYLTQSRVLWDVKYKSNLYGGFTTKGGIGTGDYWKEHFKGIHRLKKNSITDLTLFRLNQDNSPYNKPGTDLMEIKLFLKKSNGDKLYGKTTTDYLDYALLIKNSAANTPIEEL